MQNVDWRRPLHIFLAFQILAFDIELTETITLSFGSKNLSNGPRNEMIFNGF